VWTTSNTRAPFTELLSNTKYLIYSLGRLVGRCDDEATHVDYRQAAFTAKKRDITASLLSPGINILLEASV
jgi:hypothetical protein